jgi:isocitrate dehydrogenase (NAD+)
MARAITLVPGDWIGPEICRVAQELIDAVGVPVEWQVFDQIDDAMIASARQTGVVLKSRMAGGRTPGQLPPSIRLRKILGLWGQVRYVRNLPGVSARFDNVDLAIVREISEDIYTGLEHSPAPGVFEQIKLTTESACERIARFAFDEARKWDRKRVTIVHKANIMKLSDGLFLGTAQRVAQDYPEIESDEVIVDALCMRLVRNPGSFDVLLCGNLFGDIVADLATGLAGGIAVAGATNYGDDVAVFENPHGKAPHLTGTGRANPVPMIIQAINLLHHVGEGKAARRLAAALLDTLSSGLKTGDQGGTAGCQEVRDAVIARL